MYLPKVPPEVDLLFTHLAQVEPYPSGVLRIPEAGAGRPMLPGIAFFPEGTGLWMADLVSQPSVFPVGGVMVIGQDFDSEAVYHNTLNLMHQGPCDPCERNPATWGRLILFLEGVGIVPEGCFFTNFFMGLREGNKATGTFPGARDARFVNHCRDFMRVQLKTQEPRLVLTLGIQVPSRLAALSPQLSHWADAKNWDSLDAAGPVVHNVQFPGIRTTCSVVALTHPSFRPSNVGRRRYGAFQGDKAEVEMVREALERCGQPG
jgi:hypothetical protein